MKQTHEELFHCAICGELEEVAECDKCGLFICDTDRVITAKETIRCVNCAREDDD